jgi:thiosulfate/3-mercaptopyruvate sulfurtransferase
MSSALIEPHALFNTPNVKILDASYGVPDAYGAMVAARIKGAQFFDIDAVADSHAPYKHTLPDAALFAEAVGALGISNDDTVVVYDQTGISFAAARAWWMFRVFGHDKVRVLNGGLPAWVGAGLPVVSGAVDAPQAQVFKANFQPQLYYSFEQIEEAQGYILDARAPSRFNATVHTMDGDAVPAHMAHAHNLSFSDLLDDTGKLKPVDATKTMLAQHLNAQNIVTSCGSGVTACVLALALHEAGRKDVAVYDGSWTEYAHRNHLR